MKRVIVVSLLACIAFFIIGNEEAHAQQATLSIDPPTQTAAAASTFQAQVKVNSTQSINTVSATITYDGSVITPQSVDTTGSFITIWFENNINTSAQIIQLSGSIPSPGINGDNLHFATINFVANTVATTQLQYGADSAVFRDSDNANILTLGQSTGGIIAVSAQLTPEPSGTVATPVPTTVTPTGLPDAGTTTPTYLLILLFFFLALGAVTLLL